MYAGAAISGHNTVFLASPSRSALLVKRHGLFQITRLYMPNATYSFNQHSFVCQKPHISSISIVLLVKRHVLFQK
ncbi:hypothetical protein HMPREF9069_00828, partial [Atopobium sp. oral taxon 810 str. F0209]